MIEPTSPSLEGRLASEDRKPNRNPGGDKIRRRPVPLPTELVSPDPISYIAEGFGFTAFALEDGTVYQSYSASRRGVEFLMGYYGILDHAPKGRDEAEGFQLWIRRHDEYEND
jgi:predicted dithiol-disulfide oxidoreductase (DUF899 family)